ncbi:hypothetical protein [Thermus sp. FJN-A]
MREERLRAHLLALLRGGRSLEEVHAMLKPLFPGLSKGTLFALLVRLRREGRVILREGRFFLPGEDQGADL